MVEVHPQYQQHGTYDLPPAVECNQRIIDWIRDELQRSRDNNDRVSVGEACRIAFTACEKTLRAVGGL